MMQKSVHRALYLSIVHLSLLANIFAIDTSIGVLNIIDRNEDELSAINYKGEPYISVKEISRILSNMLVLISESAKSQYWQGI